MKKLALSAALLSVFAAHNAMAFVTTNIVFDPDGAGAAGAVNVTNFDWAPNNALSVKAIGDSPIAGVANFLTVGHGSLAALVENLSGGGQNFYGLPAGAEITYVFSMWENATGIGTTTTSFSLDTTQPATFSIFFDNNAATKANDLLGTGYNDGTLILSGNITSLTGNFTNYTLYQQATAGGLVPGFPSGICLAEPTNPTSTKCLPQNLDQVGNNDYPGVLSHVGEGNQTLEIDVLYQNNAFFKSNVTSLLLDAMTTTGVKAPFTQVNPSQQVLGNVAVYGEGNTMNGGFCSAGTTCDIAFQTDATTSFQSAVPEPGSLALLGLGLAALGFTASKRRRSA